MSHEQDQPSTSQPNCIARSRSEDRGVILELHAIPNSASIEAAKPAMGGAGYLLIYERAVCAVMQAISIYIPNIEQMRKFPRLC